MGLLSALGLRWIGWRRQPVRESLEPDDDTGWVRAYLGGGTPLAQDLDLLDGEALLRAAKDAYRSNPIASAIVEHTTSFVLGGGATVVAADPKVQRVVDSFWDDPENHMADRIYTLQSELTAHGELFLRFFSDPVTGRTIIRPLDPLHVTAIQTHPEDHEHPLAYLHQPPTSLLAGATPPAAALPAREAGASTGFEGAQPLVAPEARNIQASLGGLGGAQRPPSGPGQSPEDPLGGTWIPAAEILHLTINKPSSSLRGRSDLAPIIPWLRIYSKLLRDRVSRNELLNLLVWDVTVQGADNHQINALRAAHAHPPPTGSVLFHNESESWKPVNPQVNAHDASLDARAIRLMIATGSGLPEHYLGEGGNANRATAAEMGLPANKRFQRKQQLFRAFLTHIVNRVLDNAVAVGRLGPRVNRAFTVQFEELTTSPLPDVAAAIKDLTSSLALASENGWVTAEEARRLWWRYHAQADESAPQSSP